MTAFDPTVVTLVGIGVTVNLAFIGWLVRLEHRLTSRMTFEQHNEICADRERRQHSEFVAFVATMNQREQYTVQHRDRIGRQLGEIERELSYLQGQLGIRRFQRAAADVAAEPPRAAEGQ